MKRIISSLAILLLVMTGFAFADAVPQVTSPKSLPVLWTASVYNGSGADIGTALIVEWDFDTSNPDGTFYDDRTNYVQLCDSAGDIWTAGVTLFTQGITNGSTGTIIIKGPAIVREGSTVTAGDICESDANGKVQPHDGTGNDEGTIGVAIKTPSDFTGDYGTAVIYINPIQYDI